MSRIFTRLNYRACLAVIALLFYACLARAQSYEQLYSDYRGSLYQIRLIEAASNSKASLGSGFQISSNGMIATNYHVVSQAVSDPDKYTIHYLSVDGEEGELELLDVDVINDLAILRQKGKEGKQHLKLAHKTPQKGETIISMGNPLDLGMTLVPGTYNGIARGSFYDRIHFSGSINPGMSGGPVINRNGEVVGINVATAGNQISFLVPVEKLLALLEDFARDATTGGGPVDLQNVIHRQLRDNQQRISEQILNADWKLRPLGDAMVVGEIVPSIQCWGDSSKNEEETLEKVAKGCTGQDVVFLSDEFDTGRVEYEFFWLEGADSLTSSRFYSTYEDEMSGFFPGNSAGKDDVTNFNCQQQFTTQPRDGAKQAAENAEATEESSASTDGETAGEDNADEDADENTDKSTDNEQKPQEPTQVPPRSNGNREPVIARTSYCVRRYKDFPDLYDVFFVSLTVDQDKRALVSHFTLSGFTQESASAFTEKFVSEIQWH